jgi:hypothetical protein
MMLVMAEHSRGLRKQDGWHRQRWHWHVDVVYHQGSLPFAKLRSFPAVGFCRSTAYLYYRATITVPLCRYVFSFVLRFVLLFAVCCC